MKFPVLWSGLCCCAVKCSEISAYIKLLYDTRVNKVFTSLHFTLNHIRFVFCHNTEDNERDLCQDLLTIENTDSDLKVQALHYANELLLPSDLPFKNVCKHSQHAEKYDKMLGKRVTTRARCR